MRPWAEALSRSQAPRRLRRAAILTALCGLAVSMSVLLPWYEWVEGATFHARYSPMGNEFGVKDRIYWDGTHGEFFGVYTLILGSLACVASGALCVARGRARSRGRRLLSIAALTSLALAVLLTACDLAFHGKDRLDLGETRLEYGDVFTRAWGVRFTALWAIAGTWCAWLLFRRTRASAGDAGAGPEAASDSAPAVHRGRTARGARLAALSSAACAMATFMGLFLPWFAEREGMSEKWVHEQLTRNDAWRVFGLPSFAWDGVFPGLGLLAMGFGVLGCFAAARLFVNLDATTPLCPPSRAGWSRGSPRIRTGRWAYVCLLALGLAALAIGIDELWFFRPREFNYFDAKFDKRWGIHFTLAAAIVGTVVAFILLRRTRAVTAEAVAAAPADGHGLARGDPARPRAPVRGAIPFLFILLGVAALALSAIRRDDKTPVNEFKGGLPAMRISYPDLSVALGKVRGAFTGTMGPGPPTSRWPGLYPHESLWMNGDFERGGDFVHGDEIPTLGRAHGAKFPHVSHEAEYLILGEAGWLGYVDFPLDLSPRVRAYGVDSVQWAAIEAAVRAAFEPYASPVLSHPDAVRYGLVLFWIAIQLAYFVRTRARSYGVWSASTVVVGLMPSIGLALLIWAWGGHAIPRIVAYAADASWWARNSSDLLLGLIAVGVTSGLIFGIRWDLETRARRKAAEAVGVTGGASSFT